MKYYLDSNICVYFLKGQFPSIMENIQNTNPVNIKIPSIVKAELLFGAEKTILNGESSENSTVL